MWENIWLKILDLRGDRIVGVFAGCTLIIFLAKGHFIFADQIPPPVLGGITALGAIAFCLMLAQLGNAIFEAIKSQMKVRKKQWKDLGFNAQVLHAELKHRIGFQSPEDGIELYRARVESLFISLRKARFVTIRVREEDSSIDTLTEWISYLDTVGQFLSAGQVKEAKKFASDLIAEFNSR